MLDEDTEVEAAEQSDTKKAGSELHARELVFISHANPEDNAFAVWLATQLANAGYGVWCDVTQLLGGEKFWNDITEAIEQFAFRVLFVSTLESNRKRGTLRELRIACETETKLLLKDFIVPLKVDEFPFESTDNRISDRNFVRFEENWADGLSQLLELLEREGAPKSPAAGPACVSDWYQRSINSQRRVVVSNETCHSNWFPLSLPEHIYFHRCNGPIEQLATLSNDLSHPSKVHSEFLVTFAAPPDIHDFLGSTIDLAESKQFTSSEFVLAGSESPEIAAFDARNIVSNLVRQAWEADMQREGLVPYTLASGLNAWFFKHNHLDFNRAYLSGTGRKRYRQLVGTKSKRTPEGLRVPDGYWHYAVSASPQLVPFPKLVLRHHVVFTDDGETPWQCAKRMHRARRGVCKNWWNAEWRDRLFAFCNQISGDDQLILLSVGETERIEMNAQPMTFVSPRTYFEDHNGGLDEDSEIELVEKIAEDDEHSEDEGH